MGRSDVLISDHGMTRRAVSAVLAVIFLGALVVLPGTSRAGDDEKALAFIASLADQAVNTLTVKDIPREERSRRFRAILTDNFDIETIGRWVLGRYWRRASSKERQEYLKLFEDLIVATYADRFERYAGEKLAVRGSMAQDGNDTIVQSEFSRPSAAEPIRVDWRVRSRDGKLRIIDIIVEGVSMGQTQRSEFASAIRKNGGTMAGLLAELKKRVNGDA